jgi:CheY-like chemotaxis protein
MDMQMPEMDGIQATQFIRQNMENQPIHAGMNDFISKPIKLDELTGKLENGHQPGLKI